MLPHILRLFSCAAVLLPLAAQTSSNPDSSAHLRSGIALYQQVVSGSQSPENLRFAAEARAEFDAVLATDPTNILATSYIGSLYFHDGKFDEAEEWTRKVVGLDAANKEAFYTLGVIAWTRWLAVDRQARLDSGQGPQDPGPIGNAAIRAQLKATWMPTLDRGIADMEKALQLDGQYDDAMAYMNLLVRYRADLLDTAEEWHAATAQADDWMQKTLATKREKANSAPPPVAAPAHAGGLRIGGEVLRANLVTRVDPVYPPLALAARISGSVVFAVVVGLDGGVSHVQLISGHPMLVQAARAAVEQYRYKPTLLNGNPVEVNSTVDVPFVLEPAVVAR